MISTECILLSNHSKVKQILKLKAHKWGAACNHFHVSLSHRERTIIFTWEQNSITMEIHAYSKLRVQYSKRLMQEEVFKGKNETDYIRYFVIISATRINTGWCLF
jgi:hypothetical protein